MKKYWMGAFICALLFGSAAAWADSVTLNTTDGVYGSQTGSIATGATGTAATFDFLAAVGGAAFTINLTDGHGTITDTLYGIGDSFEFDGFLSGNPVIGTACLASGQVICIVNTGGVLDLTSIFSDQSGTIFSIVGGSITVQANDAVAATPEPSSLMLLGTGLVGAIGMARRRFGRAA